MALVSAVKSPSLLPSMVERRAGQARLRRWEHRGAQDFLAPAAAHQDAELTLVERGGVILEVGGRSFQIGPGQAMVVPPQVEHRTTLLCGLQGRSLHLDVRMVSELAEVMGVGQLEARALPDGRRATALAAMLACELEEPAKGQSVAVEALVEAAAVELLRAAGAEPASRPAIHDPRIGRAVQMIEERYAEPLTLEEIAASVGMSRYHFSRCFLSAVGSSPYHFLLETRLKRAAELLRRGRRTVTEVALAVGFNDLGRFAQMFRRRFGCAPAAFCEGPLRRAG